MSVLRKRFALMVNGADLLCSLATPRVWKPSVPSPDNRCVLNRGSGIKESVVSPCCGFEVFHDVAALGQHFGKKP
jgi:hypothetical protein